MSVVIQNLVKEYGQQKAVNNISFETGKGTILGFLGPNGAGKSTTMKIASCYLPPTSGTVIICGYNVLTNPVEVRRNIGYLPEHNPLYLDMYVMEYLLFIGGLFDLKGKFLKDKAEEMIAVCGLTQERKKKIGALSKGYRQRVGLAQALIHDPQVLILDEPTSGLDPNQIVEIRKLIKEVSKEKTIIFSTHIMQEVQALCDRVIIINKGSIVADGNVEELRNREKINAVIVIEFQHAVDISLLKQIQGVTEVDEIAAGKYRLMSEAKTDIRPDIFTLASSRQWKLIGLTQEETSLENIFQLLTQNS